MEWEMIFIKVIVVLFYIGGFAICFVMLVWLWWVLCGDLMERHWANRRGRRK